MGELKKRVFSGSNDIPEVTLTKILNPGERLASRKAPGPNEIPSGVIKLLVNNRAEPIGKLVNTCIATGSIPTLWKAADLTLIPKPGKKPGPSSFRPIRLLNTIAKLMESVLVFRLYDEVERNNLLSNSQYGFRKGRNTLGAIKWVLDKANE